jgi:hypothetical protein
MTGPSDGDAPACGKGGEGPGVDVPFPGEGLQVAAFVVVFGLEPGAGDVRRAVEEDAIVLEELTDGAFGAGGHLGDGGDVQLLVLVEVAEPFGGQDGCPFGVERYAVGGFGGGRDTGELAVEPEVFGGQAEGVRGVGRDGGGVQDVANAFGVEGVGVDAGSARGLGPVAGRFPDDGLVVDAVAQQVEPGLLVEEGPQRVGCLDPEAHGLHVLAFGPAGHVVLFAGQQDEEIPEHHGVQAGLAGFEPVLEAQAGVGVEVDGDGAGSKQRASSGVVDRRAVLIQCEGELGQGRGQRGEISLLVEPLFDAAAVGVDQVVAQQRSDALIVQLGWAADS